MRAIVLPDPGLHDIEVVECMNRMQERIRMLEDIHEVALEGDGMRAECTRRWTAVDPVTLARCVWGKTYTLELKV